MLYKLLVLCTIILSASVVSTEGDEKLSSHEQWVELVMNEVENLRTSRSVTPDEYVIHDIHEHYRKAFEDMDNEVYKQDAYMTRKGYKLNREITRQKAIKGRYIVFLKDDVTDERLNHVVNVLRNAHIETNGKFMTDHLQLLRYVGKGFTATLGQNVIRILKKHPQSYLVENDMVIKRSNHYDLEDVLDDVEIQNAPAAVNPATQTHHHVKSNQKNAEWNLDRLDQRENKLDGMYLPKSNGKGVDVYVLDTGIRYSHEDFGGRAKYCGYDAIDMLTKSSLKGQDCNGHGTHCAGTIGGKIFGVAKEVNLYSARVLSCAGSGAVKGILDAMEYILKTRQEKGVTSRAVFSMSVGVRKIGVFNHGVNNAAKHGIVVVSASGNQHSDSCSYSPGSAKLVISVGATDREDISAPFSNIGKCTDIFAPGEAIKSAGYECDTCVITKSGTSMACPHVAGYAAIVLGLDSSLSPLEVKKQMIKDSTKNVVDMSAMAQTMSLIQETPNRLLFVGTNSHNN